MKVKHRPRSDTELKGEKKTHDDEKVRALKTYARYSSLVFQMIALAAVGYWVGQELDANAPEPLYTGILSLAGLAIGLFLFLRAALKRDAS